MAVRYSWINVQNITDRHNKIKWTEKEGSKGVLTVKKDENDTEAIEYHPVDENLFKILKNATFGYNCVFNRLIDSRELSTRKVRVEGKHY